MNNYHLVYNDAVLLRNFTYKTHTRRVVEDDEDWKIKDDDVAVYPRGATKIDYKLWMRDPGSRGVLLLYCPSQATAFGTFGRLMDLVRAATNNVRPWRVFAVVDMGAGWLLYEIHFVVIGEEYAYQSSRLIKLKELAGVVGNEQLKRDGTRP